LVEETLTVNDTMEVNSPRIRTLLRQADRVAGAGKRAAAEKLYRQIIEEAPGTPAAWVGLAEVSADPEEQAAAFRHALELEPENERARDGLQAIQSREDSAVAPEESDRISSADGHTAGEAQGKDESLNAQSLQAWDPVELQTEESLAVQSQPGLHEHEIQETEELLYCANHPTRRTHLRCNRCGKPICSSCAKPTPVGYRCPECIREQEEAFFSATPLNYLVAALVAFPLGLLAGMLATRLGFFVIFLAALAGTAIGRIAFRAAGRKRGRWMPHLVSAAVILGGALPAVPYLLALLLGQPLGGLRLLWIGIYIVVASGSAFYQMR
jgi:hypothetical protein